MKGKYRLPVNNVAVFEELDAYLVALKVRPHRLRTHSRPIIHRCLRELFFTNPFRFQFCAFQSRGLKNGSENFF